MKKASREMMPSEEPFWPTVLAALVGGVLVERLLALGPYAFKSPPADATWWHFAQMFCWMLVMVGALSGALYLCLLPLKWVMDWWIARLMTKSRDDDDAQEEIS